MDSYVVRIYRKEQDNPGMLVGIVQRAGAEDKKVFSNLDELWSILNPERKEPIKQGKNKAAKRNPNRMPT